MQSERLKGCVTGYPRIHVSLVDPFGVTSRLFGGIGFSLEAPSTIVTWAPSEGFELNFGTATDERTRQEAHAVVGRWPALLPPISLTVEQFPPQHVGLGSKTTLLLSLLAALDRASALALPQQRLQWLSGRGGASGVGVNAFFTGGVVVDDGQPPTTAANFQPSSAGPPRQLPRVVRRMAGPESWNVALILPRGNRHELAAERTIFSSADGLSARDVSRVAELVYALIPDAFASASLPDLASHLRMISEVGFKQLEIAAQPPTVSTLLATLQSNVTVAAGMSSMGPLLYALYDSDNSEGFIQASVRATDARVLYTTSIRNNGYSSVRNAAT